MALLDSVVEVDDTLKNHGNFLDSCCLNTVIFLT